MAGWIKLEKDLENDPRVLRMAKKLEDNFVMFGWESPVPFDPSNACALPHVTLVLGAIARLWIYADSHAREDDTLDMSASELDEWLRLPGFCQLMPDAWLKVIDEHTIELPGFHAHNGVEAKKKALTQKRVERHRNAKKPESVTGRNASALPDQDQDLDQDQTRKRGERARQASMKKPPESPTPPQPQTPAKPPDDPGPTLGPDPYDVRRLVELVYPAGTYGAHNWALTDRAIGTLLDGGDTAQALVAAAKAYGEQQAACGNVGTQYIRSPAKFYSEGHWRGPFPMPVEKVRPGARKTFSELHRGLSTADDDKPEGAIA